MSLESEPEEAMGRVGRRPLGFRGQAGVHSQEDWTRLPMVSHPTQTRMYQAYEGRVTKICFWNLWDYKPSTLVLVSFIRPLLLFNIFYWPEIILPSSTKKYIYNIQHNQHIWLSLLFSVPHIMKLKSTHKLTISPYLSLLFINVMGSQRITPKNTKKRKKNAYIMEVGGWLDGRGDGKSLCTLLVIVILKNLMLLVLQTSK